MTIQLADRQLDPPVLLAPMAGITDLPFRNLVQGFGAGLVVSEMVASHDLLNGRPQGRARAELGADVAGTAVQLAGREARWMAEAARLLEDSGARMIDINMGCPARKVTGGLSGSALMREPDHALRLIEAVLGAVSVPVSVKMRLGWDETCLNAPALAARAAAAGVAMVTVHGRTRCQFYTGRANWAAIAPVVRAVPVPVVANGDITNAAEARAALAASGAAGVMIGRGVRGRPWLLAQVGAALAGRKPLPAPEGGALIDMISIHYEAMLSFYGRDLGLRVARKHLGWYLDHLPGAAALRAAILRAETPAAVLGLLRGLGAGAREAA